MEEGVSQRKEAFDGSPNKGRVLADDHATVPQCSMPAPEADQARITLAYHQDREEAREYLRCALAARHAAGYIDCSTCPERLVYDYLWLDKGHFLADSQEVTNPFAGKWTLRRKQR